MSADSEMRCIGAEEMRGRRVQGYCSKRTGDEEEGAGMPVSYQLEQFRSVSKHRASRSMNERKGEEQRDNVVLFWEYKNITHD